MKNLYPKSKGKIHSFPAPPSAAGGDGNGDAFAVLRLLPAAIFALTAALAAEDKEVVAYLMIRSISGSGPAAQSADDRKRCRRPGSGGAHRPLFDCGCFDCYTSFWSRWDCSKDREAIHMVIEAFEEHLASKENKGKEAKRKRKKGKDEKRGKDTEKDRESDEKMVMVEIVAAAVTVEEENKGFDDELVIVSDGGFADEKQEEMGRESGEDEEAAELPEVTIERRRGWVDFVGGMFNSRLFKLWNPAA